MAAPSSPPPATPEPGPAPTPPPTPLPILMGPAYETLRGLAAALRTEMGHALEGTEAAVAQGRPVRVHVPGVRMFTRRTERFQGSVDSYRAQPFDVVATAGMMHSRAGMLRRRVRTSMALQHTWEDWDAAVELLDRIRRLLAGETVTVPPPHTPRPLPPASPAPPAPVSSPAR